MTERVNINGNDVWVKVESHVVNEEDVFTATYYSVNPETAQGGILLTDHMGKPLIFRSPVEALENCTEILIKAEGTPREG